MVCMVSSKSTSLVQIYSFQAPINVVIATVIMMGRESGSMIDQNVLRSLAPSILAASNSSAFTPPKNERSKNRFMGMLPRDARQDHAEKTVDEPEVVDQYVLADERQRAGDHDERQNRHKDDIFTGKTEPHESERRQRLLPKAFPPSAKA